MYSLHETGFDPDGAKVHFDAKDSGGVPHMGQVAELALHSLHSLTIHPDKPAMLICDGSRLACE